VGAALGVVCTQALGGDEPEMKVLHVVPSYEPAWEEGGIVRSVSQLCRGLVGLGVDVTVYTTDSNNDAQLGNVPVNRPVDVGGVAVIYFRTTWDRNFRYSIALGAACHQNMKKFNLVHITSFWNYPGIPAGRAARQSGIPYVISPRGSLVPECLRRNRLKKWGCLKTFVECGIKGATAIHYTAELERELCSKKSFGRPNFIVPNGLNLAEFEVLPKRAIALQSFELPLDAVVVGYLGRLHERKALDVLIKAFRAVAAQFLQAHLLLAGPDDGRERELRILTKRLGLQDKVHFLGFVGPQRRKDFLVAADVVSLVSYPGENFGNAAVEAMAAGVPVIVSDNVGTCREIEADGAGVVVPVHEQSLAQGLIELLSDPDMLHEMGRAAYHSSRARYSISVTARQMLSAYQDVLSGKLV
jgi:glycosyltransferase involved in cell wall biosynthesis